MGITQHSNKYESVVKSYKLYKYLQLINSKYGS